LLYLIPVALKLFLHTKQTFSKMRAEASDASTAYILYKRPVQYDTLSIVQYLHWTGHDVRPTCCIERNHPEWAAHNLPAIETVAGERFVGLRACVEFYAAEAGKDPDKLLSTAVAFKAANPEHRVGATTSTLLNGGL
jgi:hypothetical protein